MNGIQNAQFVLYVGVTIALVAALPFLVVAMARQKNKETRARKQATPRSQYNGEASSDPELQRARQIMADKLTCGYCGEMALPGMKCASCGAVKKLASK